MTTKEHLALGHRLELIDADARGFGRWVWSVAPAKAVARRLPLEPAEYEYELFGAKTCSACGTDLPANADYFGVDRSDENGLTAACRSCRQARSRAHHDAHREERLSRQRARYVERYATDPEYRERRKAQGRESYWRRKGR